MEQIKRLPLGVSNFRYLREDNRYFVDYDEAGYGATLHRHPDERRRDREDGGDRRSVGRGAKDRRGGR